MLPEIYFSVYADHDVKTVPSASDIALLILGESLVDTISIVDYVRNVTAKVLLFVERHLGICVDLCHCIKFCSVKRTANDGSRGGSSLT